MNKEKAFIEVKAILVKNGIAFTVSDDAETITAKVGRIVQWFYFTRNTISVTSAVVIGKKIIETSSICKWYKDILFFCFIKGDLWIREKGFGYTIITLKKDNQGGRHARIHKSTGNRPVRNMGSRDRGEA